jgi:dipeptidyl-peptidase-4
MTNGEYYTQLSDSGKLILKYSYKTGRVVDTLFNIKRVINCPVKSIEGYELDSAETKMLVYNNSKKTYRRAFTASYYVYDIKRRNMKPVSDGGPQEAATFSPNGRMVAFARDNNLYVNKLDYGTEIAMTTDGEENKIINGMPDWLYEEEFECTKLFTWSPDSKLVAFVRIDLSNVQSYSYIRYKGMSPEFPEAGEYPEVVTFKYSKAGTPLPQATVQVYDTYYKTIKKMHTGNDQDAYYPRILWGQKTEELAIAKFDRDQTKMELYFANPRSTVSKLILTDKSNTYVDYRNLNYLRFLPDGRHFTFVSEKDGYRHAYLFTTTGIQASRLTGGNFDITNFYGYDMQKKTAYFQAAVVSSTTRDICSIDSKGVMKRLSNGQGTHSAVFSNDFNYYVDDASSYNVPDVYTLNNNTGITIRTLEANSSLRKEIDGLNLPQKETFVSKADDGTPLYGWMVKPKEFSENRKYPVVMVQYSGPDSQEATDKWKPDWEYYLAANGFIVVCVDGRGTAARGNAFRACTYGRIGVIEAKDQIAVANHLGTLPYVDKDRIGIWGWSYGGFMTLMCMTTGKAFKAGIAVAPVTDWNFYDAAYTERYMKTPQENADGYAGNSPLANAARLKGSLLIVCGLADDNVHPQNTFEFTEQLVQANKQFEMQTYTNRNHSIYGGNTRFHLYKRMSDFLQKNL